MPEHSGVERPAGRTSRTREAVHQAARELLAEGNGELTMAEISTRSGVHRATIYRRWRTVESIVLDLAVERVTDEAPVAATGNLRADLTAYVHQLLTGLRGAGSSNLLQALIAATASAENLSEVGDVMQPRVRQFQAMLDAAGVTSIDGMRLFELVLAPAYLWAQLRAPLDPEADTKRLVDTVLLVAGMAG